MTDFNSKRQQGSLTILFLAFVFCIVGFMSLGFIVGARVHQNLSNQFAADESASAMASQASQGLNMISSNNLAIASSLQIHNSVLVVGYYVGVFYAANYSLIRGVKDIAGEALFGQGNSIQTVIFDNMQVYAGAMITAAAGLTQYNNLLLKNWLYSVPAKGVEFAKLNAPSSFALPFQQENQAKGDTTKSEQPFGSWSYDDETAPSTMVTSSNQTFCMVTSVKLREGPVTTQNGERYDENSATVFMFGPNHSFQSNNAFAKTLGFLEKTVSFAKAIIDVTGLEFGFMPCGTAIRGSLYQMILKSGQLADRIIEMAVGDGAVGKVMKKRVEANIRVVVGALNVKGLLEDGFGPFGKSCVSEFKSLGLRAEGAPSMDFGPLKSKITEVLVGVVSQGSADDVKMSVYLKGLYEQSKDSEGKKRALISSESGEGKARGAYKDIFSHHLSNCSADAIDANTVPTSRKITYSKKPADQCAINSVTGQYPEGCFNEFVLTEFTHLCPLVQVQQVRKYLGANCELIETGGGVIGSWASKVNPIGKDCSNKYYDRIDEMCKGYNAWSDAGKNGSPDNGNMIVDLGCQADSFLAGTSKCKSPNNSSSVVLGNLDPSTLSRATRNPGSNGSRSNTQNATHKDLLLGFLVFKKTDSTLPNQMKPSDVMDRRMQFMALVATPWLTNKETKDVFADCSNYQEDSLKDPNLKRCTVASQALMATWLEDVTADSPQRNRPAVTTPVGQPTPTPVPTFSAQTVSQLNAQSQVLSGALKLEDPPSNETEGLKIFKRMTVTLAKARVVHWPSPEDPINMLSHMRTMWPAWTSVQADAGLSSVLGASSQSGGMVDFLDKLAGRKN
jgi:hypothetical protein